MRIATFVVICLLTLISPLLATAEPAGATPAEPPPVANPHDGEDTGMTCCHLG